MKKSVYIPDDIYEQVQEFMEESDQTLSGTITIALKILVDMWEKKKKGYRFLAVKVTATDELEKKGETKEKGEEITSQGNTASGSEEINK